MNLLELSGFNLERQGKVIIQNGELDIQSGEQVLLSGISGSGKTSLGMALAGQLYSSAYKFQFNFSENSQFAAKVTLVNQYYYFKDKSTTTISNLDLLLMTQGWRRFQWKKILKNDFIRLCNIKYQFIPILIIYD